MVTKVDWRPAYRIIDSRYPFVGLFDRVARAADLEGVLAFEALTNERVLDEVGDLRLVRAADRVSGPGTTPIMAAFTHTHPSRFSDGSFGVWYAARRRTTAIAEVRHHKTIFLQATHEPSIDLDLRVYAADVRGHFEDLRGRAADDPLYDPLAYGPAQAFARERYTENAVDGIVYRSVRDPSRNAACIAAFRPRAVTNCVTAAYLTFRWDGRAIVEVHERAEIMRFAED
ncbi:MAG: RES family NAD+ phosphorylase [Vulcanimicrobiaceae bacterium]|jgi:hypothetical protein